MKLALLSLACITLTGCQLIKQASGVVSAQSPGVAQGAGATVIGPTNAGQQTIQVADRKITFQPYIHPDLLTVRANLPQAVGTTGQPGTSPAQLSTAVATVEEHTETTIGAHQDAATLVKVASNLASWGKARSLGVLLIIFGAFALAWSHNNPDGYPLIAWKFVGIGIFLTVFDPSPWWLLLLILPAGFYVWQKVRITPI